jgi:hypothetical protein
MEVDEGNSLDKVYPEEQVSESVLTRLTLLMFEALKLNAIGNVGNLITCFSSLEKSFAPNLGTRFF